MMISLPLTVGTLVWFVSAVDLPVPVETAGIRQLLPTDLALDSWFPVSPDLPGSTFYKCLNSSLPLPVSVETT